MLYPDEQRGSSLHQHRIKHPALFGLLGFVFVIATYLVGSVVAYVAMLEFFNTSQVTLYATGLAQLLFLLAPTLYIARYQSMAPRNPFRIAPVSPYALVAAAVGIVAISILSQTYLVFQEVFLVPNSWMAAYKESTTDYQGLLGSLIQRDNILAIAITFCIVAVIPAITEELVFRGFLQHSFERRLSPTVSIALASVLFGTIHAQPILLVSLAMVGAFLGYIAWASRSILPSIVAHFLFNAFAVIGLMISPAETQEPPSAATPEDLYNILPVTILSLLILSAVVLWFHNNYRGATLADGSSESSADSPQAISYADDQQPDNE